MGIKSKKILVFILLIVIVVDNAVRINCSETNTEKKEDSVLKDKSSESEEKHEKNSQEIKFRSKDAGPSFGFIHAFFASFSVILVSEIGDKTFFIAAIMAMKHPRMTVYSGAMLALGLMTLLSALLGNILTKVIPRVYTYYASSVLFGLFGLKMLREGWQMDNSDASDEYDEANEELKESEEKDKNLETGGEEDKNPTRKFVQMFRKYMSPVFLQAFVLTFLAEWGDRSQISTIILGARENMFGTVLGGTLGHGICTGVIL